MVLARNIGDSRADGRNGGLVGPAIGQRFGELAEDPATKWVCYTTFSLFNTHHGSMASGGFVQTVEGCTACCVIGADGSSGLAHVNPFDRPSRFLGPMLDSFQQPSVVVVSTDRSGLNEAERFCTGFKAPCLSVQLDKGGTVWDVVLDRPNAQVIVHESAARIFSSWGFPSR